MPSITTAIAKLASPRIIAVAGTDAAKKKKTKAAAITRYRRKYFPARNLGLSPAAARSRMAFSEAFSQY
jgi:hypothetical protein